MNYGTLKTKDECEAVFFLSFNVFQWMLCNVSSVFSGLCIYSCHGILTYIECVYTIIHIRRWKATKWNTKTLQENMENITMNRANIAKDVKITILYNFFFCKPYAVDRSNDVFSWKKNWPNMTTKTHKCVIKILFNFKWNITYSEFS